MVEHVIQTHLSKEDITLLKTVAESLGREFGMVCYRDHGDDQPSLRRTEIGPHERYWELWNPLDNSGDAFELMTRLDICLNANEPITTNTYQVQGRWESDYAQGVEAWIVLPWVKNDNGSHTLQIDEVYQDDKSAATRRAIVRLAALMYEEKKKE